MGESTSVPDQKIAGYTNNNMDQKIYVYIWDMDETLILLKSLLNGTYAETFNGLKDVKEGVELGKMWENYILDLCDSHFFYEQVSLNFHLSKQLYLGSLLGFLII